MEGNLAEAFAGSPTLSELSEASMNIDDSPIIPVADPKGVPGELYVCDIKSKQFAFEWQGINKTKMKNVVVINNKYFTLPS